ncbi:hypothetical protein KEM54_000459 [Ascosphaera aggregata]|nr:hypothetical protein KEM54_000459 [Ascosphaera aggregata]
MPAVSAQLKLNVRVVKNKPFTAIVQRLQWRMIPAVHAVHATAAPAKDVLTQKTSPVRLTSPTSNKEVKEA